jgi:hypothetical protein
MEPMVTSFFCVATAFTSRAATPVTHNARDHISFTRGISSSSTGIGLVPIRIVPIEQRVENYSPSRHNIGEMLNQIIALPDAPLYGDEVAVRPMAVNAMEAVIHTTLLYGEIAPATEVASDGLGGIEISWKEGHRELLLSVAASRVDILPDTYLMVIDKSQKTRDQRFKTIRQDIARSLVEHFTWLKNP